MSKISDLMDDESFKVEVCNFCGVQNPKRGGYWSLSGGNISICCSCLSERSKLKLIGQFLGDALKDSFDSGTGGKRDVTSEVEKMLILLEAGIYKALTFDSIQRPIQKKKKNE